MPQVVDPLVPKNPSGEWATHIDTYGQGGYRPVADVTARDAIPLERRTEGMLVFVLATSTYYRKTTPVADNGGTWVEVPIVTGAAEDLQVRPFTERAGAATTLYVSSSGDDANDGTVGSPLATVGEALRRVEWVNEAEVTISVGAGSFALPVMVYGANRVTLQGTTQNVSPVAVVGVINSADDGGIVVNVSGLAGSAADDHVGKMLEFTGGAASGLRGHIYRSAASVGANTVLYVSQDADTAIVAPGVLDTATVVQRDTTLTQAEGFLHGCVDLRIEQANVTCTGRLRMESSALELRDCALTVGRLELLEGEVTLRNVWLDSDGAADVGLVHAKGVDLVVGRGTVVYGPGGGAGDRYLLLDVGSTTRVHGQLVVRGMDTVAILEGSTLRPLRFAAPHDNILIESALSGTVNTTNGIEVRRTPGSTLPYLYGDVSADYGVVAVAGAAGHVTLPSSSTLGTGTATNAVSADGGTNAVSEEPHIVIRGGDVDERQIVPYADLAGQVGTSTRRWAFVYAGDVVTGDLTLKDPQGRAVYRLEERAPDDPEGPILVTDELSGRRWRLPLVELDPVEPQ